MALFVCGARKGAEKHAVTLEVGTEILKKLRFARGQVFDLDFFESRVARLGRAGAGSCSCLFCSWRGQHLKVVAAGLAADPLRDVMARLLVAVTMKSARAAQAANKQRLVGTLHRLHLVETHAAHVLDNWRAARMALVLRQIDRGKAWRELDGARIDEGMVAADGVGSPRAVAPCIGDNSTAEAAPGLRMGLSCCMGPDGVASERAGRQGGVLGGSRLVASWGRTTRRPPHARDVLSEWRRCLSWQQRLWRPTGACKQRCWGHWGAAGAAAPPLASCLGWRSAKMRSQGTAGSQRGVQCVSTVFYTRLGPASSPRCLRNAHDERRCPVPRLRETK
eukprot:m.8446 g.8446  ORF g.8446 m.8446 type:complete len:335 (+) comp2858_c0_seq2:814-1818(+)